MGHIEAHSKKDNYVYIVNGLDNVTKLYDYFDKYEFIEIKINKFLEELRIKNI